MPLEQMMTLKALRVRCGMTQLDVTKALDISKPTLKKWEDDSSDMPIRYISIFAKLYNYPSDKIFFGNSVTLSEKIKNGGE